MENRAAKIYKLGPFRITRKNLRRLIITDIFVLLMILIPTIVAFAAEMITNGSFATDITTSWTEVAATSGLTVSWDSPGQSNGGMARFETAIGRRTDGNHYLAQSTLASLNSTDTVALAFWWKKNWAGKTSTVHIAYVDIEKPSTSVVRIWFDDVSSNANTWTQANQDISADINENGVYEFRFGADMRSGNDNGGQTLIWFDEISIDAAAGGDTTDPTGVAITDPTEGQRISGIYTLNANATDETGMDRVEFYYGGSTLIGTDNTEPEPFTFGWNTTGVTDGSYSLTAVAYDTSANSTPSAAINVTVDNTAPTVTSATEIDATTVDVLFSENMDGATIQAGDFGIDNGLTVSGAVLQGDNVTVRLTTSSQTPSTTYTVTVSTVQDVAGNNVGSPNTAQFTGFFVDTNDPTVSLTDPTEGQFINGNAYTLSANATDETEMDYVEFYYGGSTLIGTDSSPPQPFTFDWDTTGVSDGAYSLTAVAYDTSANDTPSAAINVTVDNTDPTAAITDPTPSQLLPSTNYAVVGTAADTNFTQYTLEYGAGASPGSWLDIGSNPRLSAVVAGTLGTWDTSVLGSGTYTIRLITNDEVGQTGTTTVTVDIDSVDPTVSSATEIDATTADVLFSEDMDGATIQAGDFSIDNGLTVSGAVLQGDNVTVRLTTSSQTGSTTYTVTVSTVQDVAGNSVGSPNSAQFNGFETDSIPPTVSITDPTEGQFIGSTYTLSANASDDTAMDRVEFYHGGSTLIGTDSSPPQPFTFDWDTTLVTEGAYSLTAVAYDTFTNSATSIAVNVIIDNTDPTAAITDPIASQLLPEGNYTIVGTADDTNFAQYTLEYEVSTAPGAWNNIGSNPRTTAVTSSTLGIWDTTPLADGAYTIRLITTDDAARSTTTTVAVTVDSTRPTVSSAASASFTTVDVLFTEDLDVPSVVAAYFTIDGGLNVLGAVLQGDNRTVQLTTDTQADGFNYTVTVKATAATVEDLAGNIVGNPNTAQFTGLGPDITPPTVSITDPTEGQAIGGNYVLSATATDNQTMDKVEFFYGITKIGEDVTSPYSVVWDTTLVADAGYALTAVAWDVATNDATSTIVNITVDNSDPTSAITSPTALQVLSSGTFSIVGTATDPSFQEYWLELGTGAVPVGWNDIGTNPYTTPVSGGTLGTLDTSGLSDIFYVVRVTTYDEAGNSSSASVTIEIDGTAPTVVSASAFIDATTVDVLFSEDMDVATIQAADFSIDGGLTVSGAVLQSDNVTVRLTTSSQTGSTTYTVTVTTVNDLAGNPVGSPNTAQFTGFIVDTTPPTVSITVPSEGDFVGDIYAIDATASDDTAVQRVEFYYDGSNLIATDVTSPYTVSWDTTALAETGYVLTAVAYDFATNDATSTAVNVTVDNTFPTSDITDPVASQLIPSTTYTVVGTATDSNFSQYTLTYGVGASPSSWNDIGTNPRTGAVVANTLGSWDTSGLADGLYTLRLLVTDLAVNQSGDLFIVDIDSSAPTVVSATAVNLVQVDVLFSEDIDPSTVSSGFFTITSSNITVNGATLLGDGQTVRLDTAEQSASHTVTVTGAVTDLAGNTVGSPNSDVFTGFAGAPTAAITSPTDGEIITGSVTVTGTAADASIDQYILEVAPGKDASSDFSELATGSSNVIDGTLGSWDASGESDGDYTIQLTTKNLSAQETIVTVRVVVDDTPPVLDSARAVDDVTVDVLFSEALDVATIAAGDFSIPGLTITNAVLLEDLRTVKLTTSAQTVDNPYTVTVPASSLSDLGGTGIAAVNNTADFTGFNPATFLRGDGNLLRRSADDGTCGGKMMGCHNLAVHGSDVTTNTYGTWGREFSCFTCHQPHGTPNIFLVKQTISTPNSGDKTVDFRILTGGIPGTHDYSMGDATDGFNDSPCEVCHTQPTHFRNVDASTPDPNHNNDSDCTSCHPHEQGFKLLGGESSGGTECATCHGSIFTPMNSDTSQYHHYLDSTTATYPVVADSTTLTATDANKRCLMCHVDHDIFRPDLNANSTGRSNNLRETIKSTVTTSSNFTNSDYSSSHADGGICLSCHTNSMTKNNTDQKDDGSTTTMAIDKTLFDNATTAHNYSVTSTFATDSSTFNANCSKCHSDTLPKSYQGGSGNAFSLHASVLNRLLAPLGIASPSSADDPLEERLCQACHAGGASAAGQDYYNVATMSQVAINVWDMFSKTYKHPITSTNGIHAPEERSTSTPGWNPAASRHVECTDCHNPHSATAALHTTGSNIIGGALLGSWGVKPTSWGAGGSQHTSFTKVDFTDASGSSTQFEAYLCFKCHSYFAYTNSPPNTPSGAPDGSPAAQTDLVTEFNPNNYAHHAAIQPGNHPPHANFTQTFVAPWGPGSTVTCSDCHASDASGDPAGTHGSANRWMLRGNETGVGTTAVFCYNCHRRDVYGDDGYEGPNSNLSRVDHPIHSAHSKIGDAPKNGIWCMSCHGGGTLGGMHGSNAGVGAQGSTPLGVRFFNGASITGFTIGTVADNGICWTKGDVDSVNNCTKGHSNKSFGVNYDY